LNLTGHRYYNPTWGRFTQPDPSGQELNPYTYSQCDPINLSDPTGTSVLACVGGIFSVVGGGLAVAGGIASAVSSGGLSTPASLGIAGAGLGFFGAGLSTIDACF
ncbi:RHS repeat-associated core domain-containing protein, partial [Amycolatopsis arida]